VTRRDDGAARGPRLTRRRLLSTAAAAGLGGTFAAVTLGAPDWLQRLLGDADAPAPRGRTPAAARVVRGSFASTAIGRPIGYVLAAPPDATEGAAPPLVLCLHGRGSSPAWVVDALGLADPALRRRASEIGRLALAAAEIGQAAPIEAQAAMLLDEFLPLAEGRLGAGGRRERRGLIGWSMGGYGVLRLAEEAPDRFGAAVAVSPPVWRSYAEAREAAPDVFVSEEVFRRNELFARRGALDGLALRIDCGAADPFAPGVRALIAALPRRPAGGLSPGGHDLAYWSRVAPEQLAFLARALTA
jgi:pimeloyl-ACP methyl ester carboxylesterase